MEELLLLFLLLFLSAFFSGAEIALFSLTAEKIQALKNNSENKKIREKIKKLEKLKSNSDQTLVTILVGNNAVNIAASSIATLTAMKFAKNFGFAENYSLIVGVVTGVMTLIVLLFGEITPKALAHQYALKYSLFATPILQFLQFILYPIIYPIALITQKFTGKNTQKHSLSEDELKAAIELSEKEGKIEFEEKELFEKVLEFDEHNVESIMTPRNKIFAIPDNTPILEVMKKISRENYSRIPIYHESLDEVIGVLQVQTLIKESLNKTFYKKNVANLPLTQPIKVPLTMKINVLLRQFQQEKNHLALVYNEYGSLIGLITLEDILEEVFGEIEDETDQSIRQIQRAGKNKFICNAEVELEQIEEFVTENIQDKNNEINWPWDLEHENKTLGYFLLDEFKRFPNINENIVIEKNSRVSDEVSQKFIFTILEIANEKIQSVEIVVETLN